MKYEQAFKNAFTRFKYKTGKNTILNLVNIYETFAERKLNRTVSVLNFFNPTASRNYKLFEKLYEFLERKKYPPVGFIHAQFYRDYGKKKLPYIASLRSKLAEENFLNYLRMLEKRQINSTQLQELLLNPKSFKEKVTEMIKADFDLVRLKIKTSVYLPSWKDFVALYLVDFSLAFHFTHPDFESFKESFYRTKIMKNKLLEFEESVMISLLEVTKLTEHYKNLKQLYKEKVEKKKEKEAQIQRLPAKSIISYVLKNKTFLKLKRERSNSQEIVIYLESKFPSDKFFLLELSWKRQVTKMLRGS